MHNLQELIKQIRVEFDNVKEEAKKKFNNIVFLIDEKANDLDIKLDNNKINAPEDIADAVRRIYGDALDFNRLTRQSSTSVGV